MAVAAMLNPKTKGAAVIAGAANTSIAPWAGRETARESVIAISKIRTYVRLLCDGAHTSGETPRPVRAALRRYLPDVTRRRIDTLLAERGLAGSRTSAAESVRAGRVRIGADGPVAVKPGQLVADDAELLLAEPQRFVSRGGIKLENALEALHIDVNGLDCLDAGASTGGFTDCLLQRGAARVVALDVAYG